MDRTTQIRRALDFRELHHGELLLLPNAWDVASAKLYEVEGFRAVGTTSAGISSALGYADGEQMALDENLAVCRRMVERLAIPVSVDLEAGYSGCVDGLAETITKAIAAGAVGVNLEDSAKAGCGGAGSGALLPLPEQSERIAAARRAAERAGVPIVINARTDLFLAGEPVTRDLLDEAIARGNAYRRAGADCVFVPDMGELGELEIALLVEGIEAPLNLVAGGTTPSVRRLDDLGVARLSFGPRPMRAALQLVRDMAREWRATGTYTRMAENASLSYDEVNGWFTACASKRSACQVR